MFEQEPHLCQGVWRLGHTDLGVNAEDIHSSLEKLKAGLLGVYRPFFERKIDVGLAVAPLQHIPETRASIAELVFGWPLSIGLLEGLLVCVFERHNRQ